MIFPPSRRKLQLINLGLVSIGAGLVGLVLWNYAFVAASLSLPTQTYPTVIPGLQDQETCEKTDRLWHDEQCWDFQHDPNF